MKEFQDSLKAMQLQDPMREFRESLKVMQLQDPMREFRESLKVGRVPLRGVKPEARMP